MNYIECHVNRCRDLRRHRNCIFDNYSPYHEFEVPFHVKLNKNKCHINIPLPTFISDTLDNHDMVQNIPLLIGLEKLRLDCEYASLKPTLPLYAKCESTVDNFLYPWRDATLNDSMNFCRGIIFGQLEGEQDIWGKTSLRLDNNVRYKTKRSLVELRFFDKKDNFHKLIVQLDHLDENNKFIPLNFMNDIACTGTLLILVPKCL